jgi:hypothetical protein
MGRRASTIQEWFLLNRKELIQCPYQLGNLKITRSSCLKQRRRSGEWAYGTTSDNYTLFSFENHLKLCRQCDQTESGEPGPEHKILRHPKTGRIPESHYREKQPAGRR